MRPRSSKRQGSCCCERDHGCARCVQLQGTLLRTPAYPSIYFPAQQAVAQSRLGIKIRQKHKDASRRASYWYPAVQDYIMLICDQASPHAGSVQVRVTKRRTKLQ